MTEKKYREPINHEGYANDMIADALIAGCALTFEVVGGNKTRYPTKSKQSVTSSQCITDLTCDNVKVYAGFAHSNGSVDLVDGRGLDFVLRLNYLDEGILLDTFMEMLDNPFVHDRDKPIIQRAIEIGPTFSITKLLSGDNSEARKVGITNESYHHDMTNIIGVSAELYLANLLELVYGSELNIYHRFLFYEECEDSNSGIATVVDSDVLVLAPEEEILKALKNLAMAEVSLHSFNEKIKPI